jgi:hypothetical protein
LKIENTNLVDMIVNEITARPDFFEGEGRILRINQISQVVKYLKIPSNKLQIPQC